MAINSGTAVPTREPRRRQSVSRFYLFFALVVAGLVLAGFSQTFFLPALRGRFSAPWVVQVHAAAFLTWIALLVGQAFLIASRKVQWHRRSGMFAVALIPVMVVSGLGVAAWATRRDVTAGLGTEALPFFFGQIIDMVMLAGFALAAVLTRRQAEGHKRLMLLATLALLGAAVGRIPVVGTYANVVTFTLLGTMLIHDYWHHGRAHKVTLVGGLALTTGISMQDSVGRTAQWLDLAPVILTWLTN